MRIYWPEAFAEKVDYVGYNHAVMLLKKALCDYITDDPKGADFRMYCNLPWHHSPAWLKKEGLPIIAYTMYESTKVPSGWVSFLNEHVSIVLVPSHWCWQMFVNSGVTRPIFVVSLSADVETVPNCAKLSKDGAPYRFLWQGVAYDRGGRKGVDRAVDAFRQLKADGLIDDQSELIVKFRPCQDYHLTMDDVRSPAGVRYIQKDLTREDLYRLYKRADCCLNPTHGEGFGLIPLEQMAAGKPVIVPCWSLPYIEKEGAYIGVGYSLKESPVTWNHKHFVLSLKGCSINIGGLAISINWMPGLMPYRTIRGSHLTPRGEVPIVLPLWRKVLHSVGNAINRFQRSTGLYAKAKHTAVTIYQEHPGVDAHVSLNDLKRAMLWCYNNRTAAEDIGFQAREYALHNWGLWRIREEFEAFIEQAKELELCRKN